MSYRSNTRSSALPSSKKTHSEQHKQILKQLLKEPANKTCVDCKTATHPRWASWNLGCFICIRCSGIHRSMGTHISKVKSVDLDAWTDEQVESMVKWGNEKCNWYWESGLPANYTPDQLKIENFIRTKYDLKKWVALPTKPDPMTITTNSKPVEVEVLPQRAQAKSQAPVQTTNLLDDDFGSFSSAKPVPPTKNDVKPKPQEKPQPQLPTQKSRSQPPPVANGRNDLKKSILSLYSSPSSSSLSFVQPQPQAHAIQNHTGSSVNSLSSSLSGLNFGPTPTQTPSAAKASTTTSLPQQNWSNEWTETSKPTILDNQWESTPAFSSINKSSNLDDDLFKNVWS